MCSSTLVAFVSHRPNFFGTFNKVQKYESAALVTKSEEASSGKAGVAGRSVKKESSAKTNKSSSHFLLMPLLSHVSETIETTSGSARLFA